MEFYRDDVDPDIAAELFPGTDPAKLSFADMVDFLRLDRFGSQMCIRDSLSVEVVHPLGIAGIPVPKQFPRSQLCFGKLFAVGRDVLGEQEVL